MGREKVDRFMVKFEAQRIADVEAAICRTLPMRGPGTAEPRDRLFVNMTHRDWLVLCGAATEGLKKGR